MRVREIKPAIKEIKTIKPNETLESEVTAIDNERETSFIAGRGTVGTPTLRQNLLQGTAPDPGETPVAPRVQEVAQDRPTAYTPRTDAQLYTALSTENRSTGYTMHSAARADQRLATQTRARQAAAPSLGSASSGVAQDRVIGQAAGQGLNHDPFRLRSAWQSEPDRRYDLYQEGGLQDANKPRSRRR